MRFAVEGAPVPIGIFAALAACLAVACLTDLRARRIPNALVVSTALLGIVLQTIRMGSSGLGMALGGLAAGLAIWLPFWLGGMLGGGDVKLFAAGAAWLGAPAALEAALLAGLCGGVVALVWLLHTRGIGTTAWRLAQGLQQPLALRESSLSARDRRVPYALAMSAGLLLEAWRPGLLLGGVS